MSEPHTGTISGRGYGYASGGDSGIREGGWGCAWVGVCSWGAPSSLTPDVQSKTYHPMGGPQGRSVVECSTLWPPHGAVALRVDDG